MLNAMEPWIASVIVPPAAVTVRSMSTEVGTPAVIPTQLSSGTGAGLPGVGQGERKLIELASTGNAKVDRNNRLTMIPAPLFVTVLSRMYPPCSHFEMQSEGRYILTTSDCLHPGPDPTAQPAKPRKSGCSRADVGRSMVSKACSQLVAVLLSSAVRPRRR